ncbi:hypothetical protein E4P29_11050 [Rhodococcus sp. 1R11]|uniref:hypothetical protein n=1 Tax=Rhodococcus sp. 1R11 TaxID=2559614 RepID=UPI001071FA8B|nr:hypothetical protein [Rhodococcus sp. 1R11]TFI43539.1 hypothetical protein E4P29_11050 [Rhodococcus sp. 1R11]
MLLRIRRLAPLCGVVALTAAVAGCSTDSPTAAPATSTNTVAVTSSAPASASPAEPGTGAADPTADQQTTEPDVGTLPISAFGEEAGYSFGTPSGQIQCRASSSTLACQTRGRPHTVTTDSLCKILLGQEQGRVDLFGYLEGGTLPCATVSQGEAYQSPHTLQYGQRVIFQLDQGIAVTCASAMDGITCTDTDPSNGAGFFLSVDLFTQL